MKSEHIVYKFLDDGFTFETSDYDEYQEYIKDPICGHLPLTVEVYSNGDLVRVEYYNTEKGKLVINHLH